MTHLFVRRQPLGVLFDDFFNPLRASGAAAPNDAQPAAVRARMDVIDKTDRFEVAVDLPGVSKDDIEVTIEGNRVKIAAQVKRDAEEKEGERVIHSERFRAGYARNFELPVEVVEDGATAAFENGVLRLTLPKRTAVAGTRLQVH